VQFDGDLFAVDTDDYGRGIETITALSDRCAR
jgi:hypothetical protein